MATILAILIVSHLVIGIILQMLILHVEIHYKQYRSESPLYMLAKTLAGYGMLLLVLYETIMKRSIFYFYIKEWYTLYSGYTDTAMPLLSKKMRRRVTVCHLYDTTVGLQSGTRSKGY